MPLAKLTRRSVILAPLLLFGGRRGAAASDPAGMALIPAGTFLMGTEDAQIEKKYAHLGSRVREMLKSETPRHEVALDAFYMDRHEVTNRRFQAFVNKNPRWRREQADRKLHNGEYLKHWEGGRFPEGRGDHPAVFVSWYAAMAYAEWAGKRLPAEAEWEYAARGGLRDAEYPWGNDPVTPDRANYAASNLGGTSAASRYPANKFGLHDMAGNVWEYCLDEWRGNYDVAGRRNEDWMQVTSRRVIRGGSWGGAPVNLRVAFRDSHPPGGAGPHVGFRCVKAY